MSLILGTTSVSTNRRMESRIARCISDHSIMGERLRYSDRVVRPLAVLVAVLAVSCRGDVPGVTASNWPEADALFHADPRWLGADGAYTVDLGGDRTLWLYGDTFLAREAGGTRADALFLRNSAAVQTGRDPSHAVMAFYWGKDDRGDPQSFVGEDGDEWFWP